MCDFSLKHLQSRPAKVADKLIVKDFNSGTIGFVDVDEMEKAGAECTAVCILPGTEIAFDSDEVKQRAGFGWFGTTKQNILPKTARFRQTELDCAHTHHDALEFSDGQIIKLTTLEPGQTATVLQLPAAPKTEEEAKEQTRLEVVA